jgi:hypothetical protein
MAQGHYLNMEKLSLKIAEEHATIMTNSNLRDECDSFTDTNYLENNIKNGYVVITMLCSFIESFLNTILRDCIECEEELLKSTSIINKYDLIYLYYHKDIKLLKSNDCFGKFKTVNKLRNEMIHYKNNYIGLGTGVPTHAEIKSIKIIEFFKKDNMLNLISSVTALADLIATQLELSICKEIDIFACDGRDGLVSYIYDNEKIDIDETRFS